MISLPTLDEVRNIEQVAQCMYPNEYKRYIQDTESFKYMPLYSNAAFFVKKIADVEMFYLQNTHYTYSTFFIFFVDTVNNDYYGFLPDNKVAVFSVHTFVAEWDTFQAWIQWNDDMMNTAKK